MKMLKKVKKATTHRLGVLTKGGKAVYRFEYLDLQQLGGLPATTQRLQGREDQRGYRGGY